MSLRGTWPQRWRYSFTRGWLRENSRAVLTEAFFEPVVTTGGLSATLDDVTTRTGVALPLLLTSGAYSNATGEVTAGSSGPTGALSVTLDGVSLSATGTVPRTGSLSATLAAATLSATGQVPRVGSLTATLGTLTASGAGDVFVAGGLTATLSAATVSAAGAVRVAGTLSATLDAVALSGAGLVTNGPTASLAATLADVTASASGTVTGEGDAQPPAEEQPSGGYGAQNEYNAARQRKRRRRDDDDESKTPGTLPAEAQAGPGSADATPQAPAADLELVRQLVAYWSGEGDREMLNRRAQRALDYALRAQSVLAMQLFERELARQMEDDEMSALLMLLAEDD